MDSPNTHCLPQDGPHTSSPVSFVSLQSFLWGGGWGEPSAGSPLPPNTSHPQRMARTRHPQRSARGLPCLGSSQGSASHAGHRVRSDCSSITTWQRVTLPAFVWTPGSNSTAFQCWEPEALEDPGSLRPQREAPTALQPYRAGVRLRSRLTCKLRFKLTVTHTWTTNGRFGTAVLKKP